MSDGDEDPQPGGRTPGEDAAPKDSRPEAEPGPLDDGAPERPLGRASSPSGDTTEGPRPRDGVRPALAWVLTTNHGWVSFAREIAVSVLVVLIIGAILFGISGVWPPMVAVESGSMEPHLYRGDLVFVMEEHRLAPEHAVASTGIVTAEIGAERDYRRFGGPGDVVVYKPFGSETATPVIHRAHFWVEEGENWYDRANPEFVDANSCEALRFCPAPYDGFITKGDNDVSNDYYDQARGISTPVKPGWIRGRAVVRIPWLGWVRLAVSDTKVPGIAAGMDVADAVSPAM